MTYKIIYIDDAKQDIKEAKAWYKKQQKGLQNKFAISIKDTIRRLQAQPEAFTIRYKNIRVAHPKTFPFGIHFYIEYMMRHIIIVAVIHDSRDLQEVQKRH